jgi:hypothetical protein
MAFATEAFASANACDVSTSPWRGVATTILTGAVIIE